MMTTPTSEQLLQNADWLRRLARSLVFDEAEADDLVQETWLAALRSERQPRDQRAWLAGVMHNLVRGARRGAARRRAREADAARGEALPDVVSSQVLLERGRELLECVQALSATQRDAVVARYYEGLSPRVIARRSGVPVATVKTRQARGLARLREMLDERHGSRPAWGALLLPLATRPAKLAGVLVVPALVLVGVALWVVAASRPSPGSPRGPSSSVIAPPAEVSGRVSLAETVPIRDAPAAGDERIPVRSAGDEAARTQGEEVNARPRIFGRVVGPDGTAVEGATVMLVTHDPVPSSFSRRRPKVPGGEPATGRRARPFNKPETRSLADGSFEFDLRKLTLSSGERTPGWPQVHATHTSVGTGRVPLDAEALVSGLDLGDLSLEPTATLAGVVVDSFGPVAGLELSVDQLGDAPPDDPLTYFRTVHTDRQGRFAFHNLHALRYELHADSDSVFGVFEPDRTDLVLRLVSGAAYTVHVLDPQGRRVREPRPHISRLEPAPGGGWRRPRAFFGASSMAQAEDGSWQVAFRCSGPRAIVAELRDETGADWLRAEAFLDVHPGQRGQLDLHLAPVRSISLRSLRVLDPDGETVPHWTRTRSPLSGSDQREPDQAKGELRAFLPVSVHLLPAPPSLALPVRLDLDGPPPPTASSPGFGGRLRVRFDPPQDGMLRLQLPGEDVVWVEDGESWGGEHHLVLPESTFVSHPALPAGSYLLRVGAPGEPPVELPVDVVAGELREVTVQLD